MQDGAVSKDTPERGPVSPAIKRHRDIEREMEHPSPLSSAAPPAQPPSRGLRSWHRPEDNLLYACLIGYLLVNAGMMATHRQPFLDFAIAGIVFGTVMPSVTVAVLMMVQACLLRFSPAALALTICSLIAAGCVSYHLVTLC